MNKRILEILMGVMLLAIVILMIIDVSNNRLSQDEINFKWEYERFNGKQNLSHVKYVTVDIKEDNNVVYLDSKKTIDFLNKKTGVLFFGYPESNYSRNAIGVLLNMTNNNIYYFNAYEIRDEKVKVDDEIVTRKEGTKDYYKILNILGDKAEAYEEIEDDNSKRLYFPTVLFVKNGKIVYMHSGTVDGNMVSKVLSKSDIKELKGIYKKGFEKLK